MTPTEIDGALDTLTVIVDTREQDTPLFRKRMRQVGYPTRRKKLNFGDYSCSVMADGAEVDLSASFAIERKMSLDELAQCYTRGRKRFEREFERAKQAGAKLYLLVEGATWESAYNGLYRTQMHPHSLIASMTAWLARYDCQILMCKAETTPSLIHDICYRETKEHLERMCDESHL